MKSVQDAPLLLAVILGAVVALPGCKAKSGKTTIPFSAENMVASQTPGGSYTHPNYRFKIAGLDNKWRILPPGEIENIIPDASGGAMRVGGLHGAVIVEPVGDVDPGDYMDLLLDGMATSVPGLEVVSLDDVKHGQYDAKTAEMDAVASGVSFRYRSVVFVHEGHGYQLLCWYAKEGDADTSAVQEFIDAVQIVEGEVTPPPVTVLEDFDGVGRRVRDSRFESPIYRLAANSSDGWSIMSESEVLRVNDSAELGMQHTGTGCYLTVIPERLTSVKFEDYRTETEAELELNYAESGPVKESDPVTLSFAGNEIEFQTRVVGTSLPTKMYYAVTFHEGIAYQVQAWHFEQKSGDFAPVIANGLNGISFLEESEARKIEAELASAPDPQQAVGPGFSLRNGAYRNFESGVVWHKPKGIWRIATGDEAAFLNEVISLQAEHLSAGLYVQLVSEVADGIDTAEYHSLIMENYPEDDGFSDHTPLPDVMLDGQPAKSATFRQANRAGEIEFRVVNTVRGEHAHQIVLWGTTDNMESSRALVDSAIAGFTFPGAKLKEIEGGARWYRDNRTGFEIRVPGIGWTMRENVQPMFKPIGNSVQFMRRDGMVLVIGMYLADNRNADQTMNNLIQELLKVNFDRSSSKGSTETTSTIAGRPARIIKAESDGDHLRSASFSDRGTIYFLMVGARKASEADKLLSNVQSAFKLLP